jgi:carboxypeptidase family protein
VLALLPCCAAFSQRKEKSQDNNLRAVEGIVTDASGAPVAKAVVQVKDTKSLQIESFITDATGKYHFAGLSTDVEYQLKANSDAATSGWKTLSLYNTKKIATVNLKLKRPRRADGS